MKLDRAKAILGPIRCGYRRQRYLGDDLCYLVDGKPCNAHDVIEAAAKTPDFIKVRMIKANKEAAEERQRKRRDSGSTPS